MTNISAGSTVPRRQLGRKLRELRETRHLTITEVVGALEWSKPRIWRYETGQVAMHPLDVEAMCRLYGADPDLVEAMKALARETRSKGWWHSYGEDLPEWFELYVGLEAAASRLRQFEAEIIPGLLQSPRYTRHAIRMSMGADLASDAVDRHTELRARRQRILTRRTPRAPQLDVVISEAALLRGFSREVMIDQLTLLTTLADRPNISLRVLPFTAGPHRSSEGPFVILDFPRESPARDPEPTTVYHEKPTGALYLDQPHEAEAYDAIWNDLAAKALDPPESKRLIQQTMTTRWSQ